MVAGCLLIFAEVAAWSLGDFLKRTSQQRICQCIEKGARQPLKPEPHGADSTEGHPHMACGCPSYKVTV